MGEKGSSKVQAESEDGLGGDGGLKSRKGMSDSPGYGTVNGLGRWSMLARQHEEPT